MDVSRPAPAKLVPGPGQPNGRSTTRTRPNGAFGPCARASNSMTARRFQTRRRAVIWNLDKVLNDKGAAIRPAPEGPPQVKTRLPLGRRSYAKNRRISTIGDHDQETVRFLLPLPDASWFLVFEPGGNMKSSARNWDKFAQPAVGARAPFKLTKLGARARKLRRAFEERPITGTRKRIPESRQAGAWCRCRKR